MTQSLDPTWHLVATDIGIYQTVVFERTLRDTRHVTSLTLGTRQRCTKLAFCMLRTSYENARRISVPIGRFNLLPESRHQLRSVSRWPVVKVLEVSEGCRNAQASVTRAGGPTGCNFDSAFMLEGRGRQVCRCQKTVLN